MSPAKIPDGFVAERRPGFDALLLLPRDLVDSGPDPAIQKKDLAAEQSTLLKN